MQINRLQFGFSSYNDEPITLSNFIQYDVGICGCKILSIGSIYITWLSKECYAIGK